MRRRVEPALTADLLLRAYAAGIFPMAAERDDPHVHWVDPVLRGVLPVGALHVSRSLRRRILRAPWEVRTDTAFAAVVTACADRPETWINAPIFALYAELHARKQAHALEVWEGDALVGGVFGIVLGGAFFGESMFSRRTDASKVALAHLSHRLAVGGFTLFDTQFLTDHLASLGGVEITRSAYRQRLTEALGVEADWERLGRPDPHEVVQRMTQTS